MDKDRVKGEVNDAAGRAKRQVGEWTGNGDLQVEGAAQQIKGKAQKVVGNVKDAARQGSANVDREHEREKGREEERERQRENERHAHHG
ncbi:MAG TPA: CsbD family protein [Terracidiphilus sp.]|nr:CsbD family protein [Terracidiphilus sp.]